MSEEGRYIKGGDGTHWVGCEETHWDCKIARLEKENARLQKAVDEAKNTIDRIIGMSTYDNGAVVYCCGHSGLGAVVKCANKWLKEYGKEKE